MDVTSQRLKDFPIEGCPISSQRFIGEMSRIISAETDAAETFYSSGSKPKQIIYTEKDLERLKEGFARTFKHAGITEKDVAVNWGAEKGHQSQWAFEKGQKALGAKVVNTSKNDDFKTYREHCSDVTVVQSLPRMLKSIGEDIENNTEYGSLHEEFPHVEMTLSAGDVMTPDLRKDIAELYDIECEDVVNFWASTETGAIGIEEGEGRYTDVKYSKTNPHILIEILEEDATVRETNVDGLLSASDEDIHPLYSIEEEVTGSILITALREEMPIFRGRLGDIATAYPTSDGPRMEFRGREDNVINSSGAMIYPSEIEKVFDEIGTTEGKMVVSENDRGYVVLDFFAPETSNSDIDIVEALSKYNTSIDSWYEEGAMELNLETYESREELEKKLEEYSFPGKDPLNDFPKSNRIGFDDSFSAQSRGV